MPAANTKHTWLAAIAAPILRPLPDILRMLPYGKSHGNQFPNLFRKTVSIKPVASARRQASPPFPVSKPCPTGDRILSKSCPQRV